MKRTSRPVAIILSIIVVIIPVFTILPRAYASGDSFNQKIKVFTQIVDIVRRSYVDDVQTDELLAAAINGMLSHLDPHSTFLTGEDYQRWIKEFSDHSEAKTKSILLSLFLKPGVAYIKINRFSSTTDYELRNALKRLTQNGMKRLILDLRGNSGGFLSAAVAVADQFLPEETKIVSTRGRFPNSCKNYVASPKRNFKLYPMIVLINQKTASSAEIVAGALQDWDRALIAGQNSFGKGLVQSQYQLDENSAVLITTSRYYTPSGRFIQRQYENTGNERSGREVNEKNDDYKNSHLSSYSYYRTAAGRLVHGGEGITPDILLPSQYSSQDSLYNFTCEAQHYIRNFAENYIEQNPRIKENSLTFASNFVVNENMLKQFKQFLIDKNNKYSNFPFHNFKDRLKVFIKGELAYVCWKDETHYRLSLSNDRQLQEALKLSNQANKLLKMTPCTATH